MRAEMKPFKTLKIESYINKINIPLTKRVYK